MDVCCSFKSLVGGQCSFDRRDRNRSTEIVPLLSCTKDVAQHKSLWQFQGVESEVELILARAAMFTTPQNVLTMTVCPSHRSSLGLGWIRGTERCRVPQEISKHKNVRGKCPKAERGINRTFSQFIMKRTGHLAHVGSGMCRTCREVLSSLSNEEKLTEISEEKLSPIVVANYDEEDFVTQMKKMTVETSAIKGHSQLTSTPFTEAKQDISSKAETPFGSLFLPSDTESLHESLNKSQAPIDKSRSTLNNFLVSRDISPIRSSLQTPWDDASERSKRYYVKKASEAVAESIKVIASEDSEKLWETLVSSQAVKKHFNLVSSETEDVDIALLESLTECYNNAAQWDTRRQILSIMVDKISFKSLQRWIPNLTYYRFKIAKQHLLIHGRGCPAPKPIQKRMKVSPEMVDNFICFITSQYIIQDLPIGQKHLTLTSGKVFQVPNVIRSRTMVPERIVQQYQQYCKELGVTCLSRSSLLRILDVCSASVRKALQGLDYITASGAKAFEELEGVADKLGELGMGMSWAKQQKQQLKLAKRYLKNDFKVHVAESSVIPDHCRRFALSDTKCADYQEVCSHTHDSACDRCSLVELSMREIEDTLKFVAATSEELDELTFTTEQARRDINAWKAHLLRAVNQDEARLNVIQSLDENSVFLVQDWAMKFLPRKYRESQSDWFAKRGLPWHITVAARRRPDQELESMTFIHLFQACSQDSNTVLGIMADVLTKLKIGMPNLESVFYRQDNAGCYHCASTIVGAKVLGDKAGVTLKRLDFSDPQGGKGACDRKAATVKAHMQIYLNEGNDIETAVQMKAAIESSGEVPGVVVTLAEMPESQTKKSVTWEGVSFVNNIQYESDCLRVWKAYNIGPGKSVPCSKFDSPAIEKELPSIVDLGNERSKQLPFVALKPRKVIFQADANSSDEEDDESATGDAGANSALFSCPEEGCVKTYQKYSSVEQHIQCGKHKRALEHETLLDRAMVRYGYELEKGGSKVAELCDVECWRKESSCNVQIPSLTMGWALKSSSSRKTRFNPAQKDYLKKKFDIGQKTGRKVDPVTVSQEMRVAKNSNGDRLFSSSEFLTGKQIQNFFSRLASKRSVDIVTEEDEEEEISARHEEALSEIRQGISNFAVLRHPIIHDTYNICELASSGKLASAFSVSLLRDMCASLDIEVSSVMVRRKKPYVDKLQELVKSCSCSK